MGGPVAHYVAAHLPTSRPDEISESLYRFRYGFFYFRAVLYQATRARAASRAMRAASPAVSSRCL